VQGASSLSALDFLALGSSLAVRGAVRLGSCCSVAGVSRPGAVSGFSVTNVAVCGSMLSVRNFLRLGSSFSVVAGARAASISVLDFLALGSSLAVRGAARCGCSVSASGVVRLGSAFGLSAISSAVFGSSISVRSMVRCGSALAVASTLRCGFLWGLSVLDAVNFGSSLSVRSAVRLGSATAISGLLRASSVSRLSVLDFLSLGSALSVRSCARLGCTLSFCGRAAGGSVLSVLDFLALGSSLSTRSFVRVGSCLAVSGSVKTGSGTYRRLAARDVDARSLNVDADVTVSSIDVTGSARVGTVVAGSVSVMDACRVGEHSGDLLVGAIEIQARGRQGTIRVDGERSMTITSAGGSLHGLWTADLAISTSDRRLKDHIAPLLRTLGTVKGAEGRVDATSWVLRELRPVSFRFKDEQDGERFGFIADEVEALLPQLVRTLHGRAKLDDGPAKGVVYQDFIALLTAASQALQGRVELLEAAWAATRQDVVRLEEQLSILSASREEAQAAERNVWAAALAEERAARIALQEIVFQLVKDVDALKERAP